MVKSFRIGNSSAQGTLTVQRADKESKYKWRQNSDGLEQGSRRWALEYPEKREAPRDTIN